MVGVGEKGVFDLADTAVLLLFQGPLAVGVLGVDRAAQNLAAGLAELFGVVGEFDDLSGAHESEVQGIEEQKQVLVLVVLQLDVLEGLALGAPRGGFEVRGWLADDWAQGLSTLLGELTHLRKFII